MLKASCFPLTQLIVFGCCLWATIGGIATFKHIWFGHDTFEAWYHALPSHSRVMQRPTDIQCCMQHKPISPLASAHHKWCVCLCNLFTVNVLIAFIKPRGERIFFLPQCGRRPKMSAYYTLVMYFLTHLHSFHLYCFKLKFFHAQQPLSITVMPGLF